MTEAALLELCPLAALGILDGEDREAFEREGPALAAVRRELRTFEEVVARLGLAVDVVAPDRTLRMRVMAPPPAE
jgi:anti-sigma-K factor RskA